MAKFKVGPFGITWGKQQADKAVSVGVDMRDRRFFYELGVLQGYKQHHVYYANKPTSYQKKLELICESTASFFVFDLISSLFSMGKWVMKKNDEIIEEHEILDLVNNPNPMQSAAQFKYDYMFFRKMGTANMIADSTILNPNSRLYILKNQFIEWPEWFDKNKHTIFLSDKAVEEFRQMVIRYKTDSQELSFPMERMRQFHDISNGIKSWWDSPSRVDSLYKVVINADLAIKSKATTADFAGKYLVGNQLDGGISGVPIDEEDENALRRLLHSKESVFPMTSNTQIDRFVNDSSMLSNLGTAVFEDIFLVGRIVGIPRDVLEMFQASTYQNQELAKAAIIYYVCKPDSQDFAEGILDMYDGYENLRKQGYTLELDFDHLPFVQAFIEKESESKLKLSTAFKNVVQAGANQAEAADWLGINELTEEKFQTPYFNGQSTNNEDPEEPQGSEGQAAVEE